MDFIEALPLLRDGKRVTRRLWLDLDGRVGSWLELVDGPPFAGPVLLVWREDLQGFRPWSGAQNDILMDDWELAGLPPAVVPALPVHLPFAVAAFAAPGGAVPVVELGGYGVGGAAPGPAPPAVGGEGHVGEVFLPAGAFPGHGWGRYAPAPWMTRRSRHVSVRGRRWSP